MMTRAELVELVQTAPEAEVSELSTLIEAYRTHDRLLVQCLLAEEVELEPDEVDALAELTEEDLDPRNAMTLDEVRAELGVSLS